MSGKEDQGDGYLHRLGKLRGAVAHNGLDGIILAPGPNLRFYTSVNSMLLERPFLFFIPMDGDPHLVAPTFESGPYLRAPIKILVHAWNDGEGPSKALENAINQLPLNGKWGLEDRMPFGFIHQLLKYARPELEDAETVLQGIRAVKDVEEVKLLGRAAAILSKSFLRIPAMVKAGITELELARKISEEIYSNGAETVDDILVQSGAMAADPHHLPSSKKLRGKESVVVDATCTFQGYFADITRTFAIGKEPSVERLYENVLQAQQAAINASEKGATVGSIDDAARSHLRLNGLDEYFTHRTGHGLGLEVHEAPYIVPNGNEILQTSMVFTVEPGVYMRDKTGVRIEDDVLVTEQGNKVLTKLAPKEFGWWR
jgi:Xaa-Pro dipeptidase